MQSRNIFQFKAPDNDFNWINIINAQKKEIEYLRKKFKFNEFDLSDSLSSKYAQRPKLFDRPGYAFLILQFPVFNQKTRVIEPEEIDFFIGRNFIITLHKNRLPPLVELANLCSSDRFYCQQYLTGNVAFVYEIISRLQEYCYPLLDHLSLDIKNTEQNIFAGHERRMVTEILTIKRNIFDYKRIISEHKNILQKLLREANRFLPVKKMDVQYRNLIEHTKNIWEILEGQKQNIDALEDTNTSLLTFKLNDIMRTLTIFSVIFLPLTLITGIFGMSLQIIPLANHPLGFWLIVMTISILGLIMIQVFKRKKWL